jgi:hypothetical protein
MITIKNADIKLYTEKGLEGQTAWIEFKRDDQDYETLKTLGRSEMVKDMYILKEKIHYQGILYYPK